jgi:hypothetical protein
MFVTEGGGATVATNTGSYIRKVSLLTGAVTTVGGGPGAVGATVGASQTSVDGVGTNMRFNCVAQIAIDAAENLYVIEPLAQKIRKLVVNSGNDWVYNPTGAQGSTGIPNYFGISMYDIEINRGASTEIAISDTPYLIPGGRKDGTARGTVKLSNTNTAATSSKSFITQTLGPNGEVIFTNSAPVPLMVNITGTPSIRFQAADNLAGFVYLVYNDKTPPVLQYTINGQRPLGVYSELSASATMDQTLRLNPGWCFKVGYISNAATPVLVPQPTNQPILLMSVTITHQPVSSGGGRKMLKITPVKKPAMKKSSIRIKKAVNRKTRSKK